MLLFILLLGACEFFALSGSMHHHCVILHLLTFSITPPLPPTRLIKLKFYNTINISRVKQLTTNHNNIQK